MMTSKEDEETPPPESVRSEKRAEDEPKKGSIQLSENKLESQTFQVSLNPVVADVQAAQEGFTLERKNGTQDHGSRRSEEKDEACSIKEDERVPEFSVKSDVADKPEDENVIGGTELADSEDRKCEDESSKSDKSEENHEQVNSTVTSAEIHARSSEDCDRIGSKSVGCSGLSTNAAGGVRNKSRCISEKFNLPLVVEIVISEAEDDVQESDETQPNGEKKKMELRSNNSTDDLLSLEGGLQPGLHVPGATTHLGTPYPSTTNSLASSLNTTPRDSPRTTPSTKRKVKPALKLNLDEATWSTTPRQKPTASARLRQNFESGKAKVTAVVQHSRTPEFRFRMVLVLLFGCIVSMVTFTWYLYQRQMLQLTIGDKIRFTETQRILHLLKSDGRELLRGMLGIKIPHELTPYDCQFLHYETIPNICMEWKYRAKVHITYVHEPNVSCYSVHWESLSRETLLKDCYDMHSSHWYGMGELRNASWPLHGSSIELQPVVTGDLHHSDFGSILERYWLSSAGVGIRVDPEIPLFVSVNASGDEKLCLESHYEAFPYHAPKGGPFQTLEYTICTASNAKSVHEAMIKQFAKLPTNSNTTEFLQAPLWATEPKLRNSLTQEVLQNYSHNIIDHGFDEPKYIVLDAGWQNQMGDLEFNKTTIPAPQDVLEILRNKGFKILLTVHPYVCLDSKTFHNGTDGNYFVSDRSWHVPLLTRWPDSNSVCALIDLTKNSSAKWFLSRLQELKTKYKIEGFVFIGGQSHYLPPSYHFNKTSVNPDGFLKYYADVALQSASLAGLSFGFRTQSKLSSIRLTPRTSTWDSHKGLQSIIPTVLNLGLIGYPLFNPGSVGGDVLMGNMTIPDNELYLRWLQVAVFLPVLQFSVPPADYGLREIKVAKILLKTRKEKVLPVMQRCLKEFLETGAPIVRPLWWMAPDDPITYGLETQFAIGDEIIVAPVTEPGMLNREVYLPAGVWRDEILANTMRGGRWLHNYSVPLDKLAYFTRTEEQSITV